MMDCCCPYIVQLHDCYLKVIILVNLSVVPILRFSYPYFFLECQDSEAWLVMDLCSGGSVLDIMQACDVSDVQLHVS